MADAYRLLADASFPKALRKQGTDLDGNDTFLTEGRNYSAGDYVLAADMTPRDRQRAEDGELDHVIEPASLKDAEDALAGADRGVFTPEHEAESVILEQYGHEVIPRDVVLENNAADASDVAAAIAEAVADGADERPGLTRDEYPSLAEVSRGDAENVPKRRGPGRPKKAPAPPAAPKSSANEPKSETK